MSFLSLFLIGRMVAIDFQNFLGSPLCSFCLFFRKSALSFSKLLPTSFLAFLALS